LKNSEERSNGDSLKWTQKGEPKKPNNRSVV